MDDAVTPNLTLASLLGEAAPLFLWGGVYLPTRDEDDLTDRCSAPLLSESEAVE